MGKLAKAVILTLTLATAHYGVAGATGSVNVPEGAKHTANGETISATGNSSPGYILWKGSTLTINGAGNNTGTTGNNSSGVDASYGKATINVNGAWSIKTLGSPANGIIIDGGTITMAKDSEVAMNVKTSGFGILSYGGTITNLNGTLNINGTGADAVGTWGSGATAMTGILASGSGTTVNMTGTTNIDINATDNTTDSEHTGTSSGFNHGLAAAFGGVINLSGNAQTTIRTGNHYDHAIVIRKSGTVNFLDNSETVLTTGYNPDSTALGAENAIGLSASADTEGGSVFNIKGQASVKTTSYGNKLYGLHLDKSYLNLTEEGVLEINVNPRGNGTGVQNYGIYALNSSKINVENKGKMTINSTNNGNGSIGVNLVAGTQLNTADTSTVTINTTNDGNSSHGINMSSGAQLNVAGNSTVTINSTNNGTGSYGINMTGSNNSINVIGGKLAINIINTTTNGVAGIYSDGYDSIAVSGGGLDLDLDNRSGALNRYGIEARNFSTVTFSGDSISTITTKGDKTGGIYNNNTWNKGVTFTDNAQVTIYTKGNNSTGLVTDNTFNNEYNLTHPTETNLSGKATLNVTTDGKNSNAIESRNGSFNVGDGATVNVTVNGEGSFGIVASQGSKATTQGVRGQGTTNIGGNAAVNITVNAANAAGIYSQEGGVTNIGDNAKITINEIKTDDSLYSNGIFANTGTVNIKGNSVTTITSVGGTARGINAASGTINIGDNATMDISSSGYNADGVKVGKAGVVNLTGKAVLKLEGTGDKADGFEYSDYDGKFTSEAGTTINSTVSGAEAENIYMGGVLNQDVCNNEFTANGAVNFIFNGNDSSVLVEKDGKVAFNGDTVITTTDKAKAALETRETTTGASIVVNGNGGSKVQITGNVLTSGTGQDMIKVTLDKPVSFLAGQSLGSADNLGEITFDISNQGTWKVTKETTNNDYIDNLNLHDSGLVDLTISGADKYGSITIGKLTGSAGVFKLNTDLLKTKTLGAKNVLTDSDVLNITGTSTGNYQIAVVDKSLTTLKEASGYLLLVHDTSADQGATFTGQELQSGGIFKYEPILTDKDPAPEYNYSGVPTGGRNWYLVSIERSDELSENAKTNIGLSESRYETYMNERSENDTLLKRLGELRFNGEDQGVWARVKRNKFSAEGYAIRGGSSSMYQVGYDKKITAQDKSTRHMGLAISHTDSTTDLTTSAALEGSATTGTIYDTWHGNKGHYLDLVAKVGRMKGDFELTGDYPETGSSSSLFYNMSAEYGRKILTGKSGWYYEPQVQFGMGRVGSDSYTSSQGNEVYFDKINSALGRIGMNIGRNFGPEQQQSKIYASVSWSHEFGGGVNWHLADRNGDALDDGVSYGGSWWTVGLGTAVKLSNKTYFYFDMEKDYGGKLTNDWLVNGGFRFAW